MERDEYKIWKTVFTTFALCAAATLAQGIQAAVVDELEPCINGGVSATGLYVSQAEEEQATTTQVAALETGATYDEQLEPCINGGVSATGLYVNQAVENEMIQDQYVQAGDLGW